ncbi:MAG: sugar transporter permease [Verrucomicrobiales bacterium]|nr:sugar transporter permease [Verrucomicrobiales bacterium]
MNSAFNSPTWHKLKWPLAALMLVLLYNYFYTPGFFQIEMKAGRLFGSLIDVLNRAAPVMIISLGMTLVIATGGVDLSVGAVMAISGAIAALLIAKGFALPLVLMISLGVAIVAGVWNGLLIGYFKVPPIVATLILMVSGRGVAQLLTGGNHIPFKHAGFEFIGRGYLAAIPFAAVLTLLLFITFVIISKRTAAGLFIEATGDNEVASRYAGVQTRVVQFAVYAACSLCAGIAGLIATANLAEADPSAAGIGLELDAILAVVIGGTALQGGRYFLAGSLMGAILLQTLTTTILTRGVPTQWTQVVKALVIIIVCLLQSEVFRRSFQRKPATA